MNARTIVPVALAGLLGMACAAPSREAEPAPPGPPAASAATSTPPVTAPTAAVPVAVRIAHQPSTVSIGYYLATERGYFRQEGIEPDLISFSNASEMIPALATDQIDTATVGGNPAMWNAAARGVPLKLIADQGTFRPGHGTTALLVRKSVYDAGRGCGLEDLRGLNIAFTPPGKATTNACAAVPALQRVGQTLDDLTIQPLPFPDMVAALANGSVDAAMIAEPFLTRSLQQGTSVKLIGEDELYPNFTVGMVGFASRFYDNRPVARAFVRAYLRGVREFNAAIARPVGDPTRTSVEEIMARYRGIDLATVQAIVPPGIDSNGQPNQESLLYCYRFFRDLGLIPEPVPEAQMAALWGTDVLDEALAEIGRLPES